MPKTTDFYQTPGTYTNPSDFRQLFQALPDDNREIVKFTKMVLIHPLEARNIGLRFNYKKTLRSQVDHRSIDDILANPQVNALLNLNTPHLRSEPAERGIFSCDHHALLFTSILRLKGRAVRVRCGYAAYIVPGMLTPHWLCEVYDEPKQRWEYIDPEQGKFEFEDGAFLPAGQVWLDVRQHGLGLDRILPDFPRRGLDGIKYRLLNDINALMKNELLNYDWLLKKVKVPRLFQIPVSRLTEGECIFLEILAALALDADAQWSDLCDQYSSYVHPENLRTSRTQINQK